MQALQPLPELINGLKLLEPFLKSNGFFFVDYENGRGSGGQFTNATYINNNKKFSIGYRYSVSFVTYQHVNSIVSHGFYLDKLGYGDKKQFPDFQSDDKLLSFQHILYDFIFLVDDFFKGNCKKLKEIAPLQQQEGEEINRKAREDFKNSFDLTKINEARHFFKDKKYKDCIRKYLTVEKKSLLTEFDMKAIEFCKKHSA